MITVLRTVLFLEIKVCLIGRNRRACSQSFYQENILIIKTFCPFVLLSIIIICSYVLLSKIQLSGRSTGDLRGMYGKCLNNISRCSNPLPIDVLRILREISGTPQILFYSLGTFETILYLCKRYFCYGSNLRQFREEVCVRFRT